MDNKDDPIDLPLEAIDPIELPLEALSLIEEMPSLGFDTENFETQVSTEPTWLTFNWRPLGEIQLPARFIKACDPLSPKNMRMMAAKALIPMPPKDQCTLLYQLLGDRDIEVRDQAFATLSALDEKIVLGLVSDATLASDVLRSFGYFTSSPTVIQKLVIHTSLPDDALCFIAAFHADPHVISMIVENQLRLLQCHDVIRALKRNKKVFRSDLDRAVDFMVREGIFLDDVPEFEDSFLRLGKSEMLAALNKVRLDATKLPGVADGDLMKVVLDDESVLSEEETEKAIEGKPVESKERVPLSKLPIPYQIKAAMTGSHARAVEALGSSNRMVASAGIRNPRVTESDVARVSRSRNVHEDVIRYICDNPDWTKSYVIKFTLIQNPKTPPALTTRWLPLLRQNDLRTLAKSKQVPSSVQLMSKRILQAQRT